MSTALSRVQQSGYHGCLLKELRALAGERKHAARNQNPKSAVGLSTLRETRGKSKGAQVPVAW